MVKLFAYLIMAVIVTAVSAYILQSVDDGDRVRTALDIEGDTWMMASICGLFWPIILIFAVLIFLGKWLAGALMRIIDMGREDDGKPG